MASLIIRSNQQVLNIREIVNNHDATHIHILYHILTILVLQLDLIVMYEASLILQNISTSTEHMCELNIMMFHI